MDGLIEQSGFFNSKNGYTTTNFAIKFAQKPICFGCCEWNLGKSPLWACFPYDVTTESFVTYNNDVAPYHWEAKGY